MNGINGDTVHLSIGNGNVVHNSNEITITNSHGAKVVKNGDDIMITGCDGKNAAIVGDLQDAINSDFD